MRNERSRAKMSDQFMIDMTCIIQCLKRWFLLDTHIVIVVYRHLHNYGMYVCCCSAFNHVLLASVRLFILLTTENYPVSFNYIHER